ncbi:hypothetical protein D3C75_1079550 [compost metagenome]
MINVEKVGQRLLWSMFPCGQLCGKLAEKRILQQRDFTNQIILTSKMIVKIAHADARCQCDISHTGLVKTLVGKAMQCGINNFFSVSHGSVSRLKCG